MQERAYSLWEQDPSRSAEQNWHLATAQLESEAAAAQPGPALFKTAEAATAVGRKRLSTVSARHQLLAPTTNHRVPIEYSVHKVLVRPRHLLLLSCPLLPSPSAPARPPVRPPVRHTLAFLPNAVNAARTSHPRSLPPGLAIPLLDEGRSSWFPLHPHSNFCNLTPFGAISDAISV